MFKSYGSLWNALFHHDKSTSRLPWWLVPPVRFSYLVIQEFSRNRCSEKASALGFQTVFSLIPAFALALFFFRVFGDFSHLGKQVEPVLYRLLKIDKLPAAPPETKSESKDFANSTEGNPVSHTPQPSPVAAPTRLGQNEEVPTESTTTDTDALRLDQKIQELVDRVYLKLSTGSLSIVSFALLVVAALQLALTFEKSLNEIWGSAGQRRLLRRIAMYWSMLTLGPVLIGLSIYAAKQVGVTSRFQEMAVSVVGPLLALYLIYQLIPSSAVHPLTAVAGAFTAALLLQIASVLFGMYLKNAVGYEKLYGNLALIPIFLFWLWINWVIVLTGAEAAYTLQNLDRLTAEERRRRGRPFIQPGLTALGLVLHAGRAFQSGKGAVNADELAHSSGLPDKLWLQLVDALRERRILIEAGPDGSHFIPGRPLESLRVEEIFAAVDDSLVVQPDENIHPEQEQLRALSKLLAQSRQRQLGPISIADLLETKNTETQASPGEPKQAQH